MSRIAEQYGDHVDFGGRALAPEGKQDFLLASLVPSQYGDGLNMLKIELETVDEKQATVEHVFWVDTDDNIEAHMQQFYFYLGVRDEIFAQFPDENMSLTHPNIISWLASNAVLQKRISGTVEHVDDENKSTGKVYKKARIKGWAKAEGQGNNESSGSAPSGM